MGRRKSSETRTQLERFKEKCQSCSRLPYGDGRTSVVFLLNRVADGNAGHRDEEKSGVHKVGPLRWVEKDVSDEYVATVIIAPRGSKVRMRLKSSMYRDKMHDMPEFGLALSLESVLI